MPRIQPVAFEHADDDARTMLEGIEREFGMMPNIARTMARSPAVLDAYLDFSEALERAGLPAEIRERIALTVSAINRCEYCASAHAAISKDIGIPQDEIDASLHAESGDDRIRAALKFAQAIVQKHGLVGDVDLAAVREAGYGDVDIVEIVATVALTMFTNYFNHVAGTEVDFPRVDVGAPVF